MFTPSNELAAEHLDKLATGFDHRSLEYRSNSIDIVSHMQAHHPFLHDAEIMGRKFRLDEIDSVILILLGAGLDTTQALFGMAAVYLANNPDKRQQLIDAPELIENAIEEFLRVFPPN